MYPQSYANYTASFKPVVIIFLLLLYSATVLASATDDYSKGIEFFKKGDYQSAIASFKSAERKGMASAALFYNLGSSYYKIEDYAASKKYFTLVTDFPDQRALAEFNLGMIALKQDDTQQALSHFQYAQANSRNQKIVDASTQSIAALSGKSKRWGVYALANFGYDDNISVTPDNLALGLDDTFWNVYASADFALHRDRKNAWLVDAAYFNIDYTDSDNFDQDFYTIGLRNEHRFSNWETIAHLKYGNSTFGNEDLQSVYKLDLLGSRPLTANSKIILRYRYDDFISENPVYDYLEGWRQRLQVMYLRNTVSNNQQVYYEGELNNRGELITSLYSYDYSPTRHTLGVKHTHKFTRKWYLTGDVSYRVSDFPASATLDRDDTRWMLAAYLDYYIDPTLIIKGNVKYIDNESTVDIYTYDKTMISLGLSKLF